MEIWWEGTKDEGRRTKDQSEQSSVLRPSSFVSLQLDILDLISSLVDKSLLRQEDEEGDEPYFAMLETIREYATERLGESGEEDQACRKHASYFLELAETAEPELRGP